jgi:hypothetical protein
MLDVPRGAPLGQAHRSCANQRPAPVVDAWLTRWRTMRAARHHHRRIGRSLTRAQSPKLQPQPRSYGYVTRTLEPNGAACPHELVRWKFRKRR